MEIIVLRVDNFIFCLYILKKKKILIIIILIMVNYYLDLFIVCCNRG